MGRARGWGWVLASTGLGSFVTSANLSTVNVAVPDLRASFEGQSLAALGWVVNAYTIAFAAVLLPSGRVADSLGRRRTFFVGLAVFSIGGVLSGIAPTLVLVVVGRAIQGVGGALIVPASLGLLLEASPPEELTASVALYGGITALGVATGPTLGAIIVDNGGWRWSFLLTLPFAAAAWACGWRYLSKARSGQSQTIDLLGVVLVAASMAAVSLGIAQGPKWGWGSAETLGSIVGGVIGGGVFVWRCRTYHSPVLPLDLFKVRSFAVSTSATVMFGISTGAILLANILFLTGVWKYSIVRAGLAMAPSPVVAAIVAPVVGRLGAKIGERYVGVPGALILAMSTVWYYTHASTQRGYWTDWFPGTVMAGLGINMAFPMLQSSGVRDVGPSRFSIANASTRAALQVGTAIGVSTLVAILGDQTTELARFRRAWVMIAVFAVASAALVAPIPARETGERRASRRSEHARSSSERGAM